MVPERAIVRPPGAGFAAGLTRAGLGAPDLARALGQHAGYVDALRGAGIEVTVLDPDPDHPDATFVEDAAIVTPRGALLTRPGAPSRRGEPERLRAALTRWFEDPGSIEAPGTLDGGDVCEAGSRWIVGISERTNPTGAEQLGAWLDTRGYATTLVDVRRVPGLLHLKSGLASLGDGLLATTPALAGRAELRGFEILPVHDDDAYAANLVRVGNAVLVAAGFPRVAAAVAAVGLEPVPLPMSEFRKMDGGLSCLSLRF